MPVAWAIRTSANPITDFSPLIDSPYIGRGLTVYARGLACGTTLAEDFAALKAKGIALYNDCGENGGN